MQLADSLVLECDRAVRTSRSGDTRLGLELAQRAYRRARAEAEEPGLLLALNTVAICQSTYGAHFQGLASAIDAYRLATALGSPKCATYALLTLAGASHDVFASSKSSIRVLNRCLKEALALDDASLEVRARNARGNLFARLQRFAEGHGEFARALELIPKSDGTTPACLIVGNIAFLAVREAIAGASSCLEAHRRIDEAFAQAVREQSLEAETRAHFNRAALLEHEGELASALKSYERALELAKQIRNRSRMADIQIGIGGVCSALHRYEDAVAAYEAVLAMGDDLRPAKQLQTACERLAEAHDRAENPRAAEHARSLALQEHAMFERERAHARLEFDRIWKEVGKR